MTSLNKSISAKLTSFHYVFCNKVDVSEDNVTEKMEFMEGFGYW